MHADVFASESDSILTFRENEDESEEKKLNREIRAKLVVLHLSAKHAHA